MNALVIQDRHQVRIPAWVSDLDSFCRWATSADFPRQGSISYLNNEVWVDLSMEEMNHNQLKGILAIVLGGFILAGRLGRYYHDRMSLSNPTAGLATEPDGMYVSWASFQGSRVRLIQGRGTSPVRLEGTPDLVCEVVSPTSVAKDLEELPRLYWLAGIPEYWLLDPRHDPARFSLFRHAAKGYVATRPRDGWLRSRVLGRSFRLTQRPAPDGQPEYTLQVAST
jgi:Uma2 family endonuclease